MKKYILPLLFAIPFFFISCTSDDDDDNISDPVVTTANLEVSIGHPNLSATNVTVDIRLSESLDDLKNNVYVARKQLDLQNSSKVVFEKLKIKKYYITAFDINDVKMVGQGEIELKKNVDNKITIDLYKPNTKLEVTTNYPDPSADVTIVTGLAETLKNLEIGNYLLTKEFELKSGNSILFEELEPKKYYVKSFNKDNKEINGFDSIELSKDVLNKVNINLQNNPKNGNLEVFVKLGLTTTYCGGAKVRVYASEDDLHADNWLMEGFTDATDPTPTTGEGAIFKNLPFAQYYVKATWESSPNDKWAGYVTTWVPKGVDTKLVISVAK